MPAVSLRSSSSSSSLHAVPLGFSPRLLAAQLPPNGSSSRCSVFFFSSLTCFSYTYAQTLIQCFSFCFVIQYGIVPFLLARIAAAVICHIILMKCIIQYAGSQKPVYRTGVKVSFSLISQIKLVLMIFRRLQKRHRDIFI